MQSIEHVTEGLKVISPLQKLKSFYENKNNTDLSLLDEIYCKDIIFKDPLHKISGLTDLRDYMARMYAGVEECRFEYLDEVTTTGRAYIKWNMHFRHPKLANKLITVRGVSQLHYDEKITFHEDIYDLSSMLYEHIPFFGSIVRFIKSYIAGK